MQDIIFGIIFQLQAIMKRDSAHLFVISLSLKYYKRKIMMHFPSKAIRLQLYELSPSRTLKR